MPEDDRDIQYWKDRYFTQKLLVQECVMSHKEANKEITYLRRYIRETTGHEVPSRSSQ
jgi:hypothetical protein